MAKSTSGYPAKDPQGAKPLKDPQLDMRTWKEPVPVKPKFQWGGNPLTPQQQKRIQDGQSKLA